MNAPKHRYRITVTPIENDGQACLGRCAIEFERNCQEDWMRRLEGSQRLRGFSGDERAALVAGVQLLEGLMHNHAGGTDDIFAPLRPGFERFAQSLKQPH